MSERPLIEVAELAARLADDRPPVLADVRWTLNGPPGRPEFEQGHLPGAYWLDLANELSGPLAEEGGRHPLPDPAAFDAVMRRIGVSADREVVVYDGANSLAASRLWWLLTDAGHPRVRVLNGGFAAWVASGGAVESGPEPTVAPGTFVGSPGHRPRSDGGQLAEQLGRDGARTLVDVRAAERYRGETEPIDPVAGHIPGALNRPSMDHVDAVGRFRSPAVIAEHFAGIERPVLYCGSGITASHTLLALESAGRTDGSIYPGSWSDWISDPSRPVTTGPHP